MITVVIDRPSQYAHRYHGNLGVFYDNGLGVPQDKVRALSAAQGREGAAVFET